MDKIFLRKLYGVCRVPVAVFCDGMLTFQVPAEFQSVFGLDREALGGIIEIMGTKNEPGIFMENEKIFYGAVRAGDELVILGPISRAPVDEVLKLEYCHVHGLKKETAICRMELSDLAELLCLIFYEISGKDIKADSLQIDNGTEATQAVISWNLDQEEENYQLEESEQQMDHNSIAYENRLLEVVRTGNVEAMEKMIQANDTLEAEHIGNVAEKANKKAEYLVVVLIALLARAAAEGGMTQEDAFGRADLYLRRLEKCRTSTEMYSLGARAEYEYTQCVREAKENASRVSYVEQCKSYIAKNLRRPFSVEDIADALGMSRTYLTRRFSETEGISIHKYIMRERCEHAANMLKYSDYPIALISEYFCFSSQSHFGKVFREFYGMTPKEYRNLNQQ